MTLNAAILVPALGGTAISWVKTINQMRRPSSADISPVETLIAQKQDRPSGLLERFLRMAR